MRARSQKLTSNASKANQISMNEYGIVWINSFHFLWHWFKSNRWFGVNIFLLFCLVSLKLWIGIQMDERWKLRQILRKLTSKYVDFIIAFPQNRETSKLKYFFVIWSHKLHVSWLSTWKMCAIYLFSHHYTEPRNYD